MSTGGTGSNRSGRDGDLPAGYWPLGGAYGNPAASDAPANGAPNPPTPADKAASEQLQVVENLKAGFEALERRLTVREPNNESLARANDRLVGDVEALRKVDFHEEERRVAESRRQSGDKTKTVKKRVKVTRGKSVRKDDQANAMPSSSSDDYASGSNPTSSPEDNSNATDTSFSDDGLGPSGPPSPPSEPFPSDSSSESEATARKRSMVPTKRKKRLEKANRITVIRPANSRFMTLLEYTTYFLLRRQLTYTPKEASRSHRLNNRLDGAFYEQHPFTGALPVSIFTFLATFRHACDAAGLSHGQALPLMVLNRAGNAKIAFSGELNSTLGRKRYAIRTYGDAVNWLLSKYATRARLCWKTNAYLDTITMKQQSNEAPTAFRHLVETQYDLLSGWFNIQNVTDVVITGVFDLEQAHVRVLNDQFPERTLSETVATARLYCDGTNKLRLQLKMTRPTALNVPVCRICAGTRRLAVERGGGLQKALPKVRPRLDVNQQYGAETLTHLLHRVDAPVRRLLLQRIHPCAYGRLVDWQAHTLPALHCKLVKERLDDVGPVVGASGIRGAFDRKGGGETGQQRRTDAPFRCGQDQQRRADGYVPERGLKEAQVRRVLL